MIEKERIEEIKRSVDLKALVESRGVKLKKNGKGYIGLCPFHADHQPSFSITTDKNLWQCFGCGKGGDSISFIQEHDHVDFKTAVAMLSGIQNPEIKSQKLREPAEQSSLHVKERKLLAKVVTYYQHSFTQDLRGLNYLKTERGINDNQSFKDFGLGFVNGTLLGGGWEDGTLLARLTSQIRYDTLLKKIDHDERDIKPIDLKHRGYGYAPSSPFGLSRNPTPRDHSWN